MTLAPPLRFLADICPPLGWRVDSLDEWSGQLARVSKGDIARVIGTGQIPLYWVNDAIAHQLARDKSHSAALLERAGIANAGGALYFADDRYAAHRPPGREVADALAHARAIGYPVFVKPNVGSFGNAAERLDDEAALTDYFTRHHGAYFGFLLQRVVPGAEYRLFVQDGQIIYSHRKDPAMLVGDGIRTLAALIADENAVLAKAGLSRIDPAAASTRALLGNRALSDVPAMGDRIAARANANLSTGGAPAELRVDHPEALHAWAGRVAGAIGLRIAGLDVLTTAGLDDPAAATVLEVNGNPRTDQLYAHGGASIVRDIWAALLGELER